MNPCRILDGVSEEDNPLETFAWFWDNRRICIDYPAHSGACSFCYAENIETFVTCSSCRAVNYCSNECMRDDEGIHSPYCDSCDEESNKFLESLRPKCGSRFHCYKCNAARVVGSLDYPCPYVLSFDVSHPLFLLVKDLFTHFISLLIKHENDSIPNSKYKDVSLGSFTQQRHHNDVTSKIIYFYVKFLHDLSCLLIEHKESFSNPFQNTAISRKMLIFYNILTTYHRDFNVFAKFESEAFPWWELYLLNWSIFSESLLGLRFLRESLYKLGGGEEEMKKHSLETLSVKWITPITTHKKPNVRRHYDKVTNETSVCSLCGIQISGGEHIVPWITEFLSSCNSNYPVERLWPYPYTTPDLLIEILYKSGKIPTGLICSYDCLIKLKSETKGTLKRLSLCSGQRDCHKILEPLLKDSSSLLFSSGESKYCESCYKQKPEYKTLNLSFEESSMKAIGALSSCDFCGKNNAMILNCSSCQLRSYCSFPCLSKDKASSHHDCFQLMKIKMSHSIRLKENFRLPPSSLSFLSSFDTLTFSSFQKNNLIFDPVSLFLFLLKVNRIQGENEKIKLFTQSSKPVFSITTLVAAVLTQKYTSLVTLSLLAKFFENLLGDENVSYGFLLKNEMSDLLNVFETSLANYSSLTYDLNSHNDLLPSKIFKIVVVYIYSLAMDCCMRSMEKDSLESQTLIICKTLYRCTHTFVTALSSSLPHILWMTQSSYIWISLHLQLLSSLSRIMSFGYTPSSINSSFLQIILTGQSNATHIRALEFRLIILITYLHTSSSTLKPFNFSYTSIQREMTALVKNNTPLHLYIQFGSQIPHTTLLQNYVSFLHVLIKLGDLQRVYTDNLLFPISLIVTSEPESHVHVIAMLKKSLFIPCNLYTLLETLLYHCENDLSPLLRRKLLSSRGSLLKILEGLVCHPCFKSPAFEGAFQKLKSLYYHHKDESKTHNENEFKKNTKKKKSAKSKKEDEDDGDNIIEDFIRILKTQLYCFQYN